MIPGVVELVNDWAKRSRSRSVDAARNAALDLSRTSSTKYEELQSMTFWDLSNAVHSLSSVYDSPGTILRSFTISMYTCA